MPQTSAPDTSSGLFSSSSVAHTASHGLRSSALIVDLDPSSSSSVAQEPQGSALHNQRRNGLIIELDEEGERGESGGSGYDERYDSDEKETTGNPGDGSGEWAVTLSSQKRKADGASHRAENEQPLEVEDLEDQTTDTGSGDGSHQHQSSPPPQQHYLFQKLSDVPTVRDPREIEAVDRALETFRQTPPHRLTTTDKVWQLAAQGGSTLAGEGVELDRETRERVKETLRKNKLTDKTTLAF